MILYHVVISIFKNIRYISKYKLSPPKPSPPIPPKTSSQSDLNGNFIDQKTTVAYKVWYLYEHHLSNCFYVDTG
jgi:hypothetical protein